MPDERDIERLLREYAAKRLHQAGQPELHAVTRRMLQEEVSRAYSRRAPDKEKRWAWLSGFWPKLALASAVLVVLAFGVWLLRAGRQPQETRMARVETGIDKKSRERLASAPVQSDASWNLYAKMENTPQLERAKALAEKPRTNELQDRAMRRYGLASTPAPATPRAMITSAATRAAPASAPALAGRAQSTSGTAVPASAVTAALANNSQNFTTIQRFSNQAPSQPEAELRRDKAIGQSAAPVLASFQIEQIGDALRVVDKDGSIYTGKLQSARPSPATKTSGNLAKSPQDNLSPEGQNYSFEVVGTNRTLNQKVVFKGELIENAAVEPQLSQSLVSNRAQNRQISNFSSNQGLQYLNTKISGKAVVGQGKEIPVEALPY